MKVEEDDVLMRIRDEVRARRAEDARWEGFARGDAAELEELERLAASDPEKASMLEACRPLGDAAEERITEHVVRAARARQVVVPITTASAGATAAPTAREKRGSVGSTFARRAVVLAGPFALAAALVLYVTTRGGESEGDLPGYSVAASSQQEQRGASQPSPLLRIHGSSDARFEIVARPATATPAHVVAYAFAMREGDASPLEAKVEVAPEGSVRIVGSSRVLEGASELRVVIGAPDAIGRSEGALTRAKEGRTDRHVRVLIVAIDRE